MFGEARIIKLPGDGEEIILDGEGERKLKAFSKALTDSKSRPRAPILHYA